LATQFCQCPPHIHARGQRYQEGSVSERGHKVEEAFLAVNASRMRIRSPERGLVDEFVGGASDSGTQVFSVDATMDVCRGVLGMGIQREATLQTARLTIPVL